MRWNAAPFNAVNKPAIAKIAVPLVAASMLLAGCGADPKPAASPSTTKSSAPIPAATPTTTKSPPPTTETDLNVPAGARAHTVAGAEAFTRYFFERLNVAWTVPRAGILSPLCQPSALACTAFEKTATRLAKQGHRYDGNPVTIKFIGVLDQTGKNQLGILANLVQERRSEIDGAGKIHVTDKRENFRLHFQLLYAGHAWSVLSSKVMK